MKGTISFWEKIRNAWKKTTWDQKLILSVLFLAMIYFWPLCMVRETVDTCAADVGDQQMKPLEVGSSVTQYFTAVYPKCMNVGYVLGFDPEQPLLGDFLFEIMDEAGEVLYSSVVPFNLTPDYRYSDVPAPVRLKKGEKYAYRLTNVSVRENVPQIIYFDAACGYENTYEMLFDGIEIKGAAASTQYTWSIPWDWRAIGVYWGVMGVMAFAGLECCSLLREKAGNKGKKQKIAEK